MDNLFFGFFGNVAYASVDSFVLNANRLIVNPLIGLLFALALGYFLYGVVQFIANQENETKKNEGKNHMLWGLVGLVVMIGVWGILQIVLDSVGITGIDPKAGTVNLPAYNPDYKLGN